MIQDLPEIKKQEQQKYEEQNIISVSETEACYTVQNSRVLPGGNMLQIRQPADLLQPLQPLQPGYELLTSSHTRIPEPDLCSSEIEPALCESEIITHEPFTGTSAPDISCRNSIWNSGGNPARDLSDLAALKTELEKETDGDDRLVQITLIPVESDQNVLLLEAPRYPEKCRRWKDIGELTHKRALETLLKQGKTPEAVAAYLNCTRQQVYRAMKAHNIPTARAYAPALLEHKLNLTDPKLRLKK